MADGKRKSYESATATASVEILNRVRSGGPPLGGHDLMVAALLHSAISVLGAKYLKHGIRREDLQAEGDRVFAAIQEVLADSAARMGFEVVTIEGDDDETGEGVEE